MWELDFTVIFEKACLYKFNRIHAQLVSNLTQKITDQYGVHHTDFALNMVIRCFCTIARQKDVSNEFGETDSLCILEMAKESYAQAERESYETKDFPFRNMGLGTWK